MSKGSGRRPEAKPGLYADNHERIFGGAKTETEAERQGREENEMYHADEAEADPFGDIREGFEHGGM